MNGKAHLFIILFISALSVLIQAQQLTLSSQEMEDLLYRDESAIIPEQSQDVYPDSDSLLIDLNKATAEELEATGILTSYQIYNLLNYREKYGPLYSIYELAALPGFYSSYILKNETYLKTGSASIPESRKAGQHMILINLERTYSDSEAGTGHLGPPMKSILRIRSHPRKQLSLALSYEKDGGEPFFYQKRPQFLSACMSYEGKHFLKQLVVGNYRLNQGAGLVNGSGFIHRAANFRVTRQAFSRIKPYASITESMYEQGMACRMETGKFQFMLWASYHNFSLSKATITEHAATNQWFDLQRVSGLYRTESEVDARDLAYRIHSGIQVLYRQQGLSIGVLSGREWTGLNKKVREQLDEKTSHSQQQKYSIHGNWYRNKIQLFGELSSSEFSSLAFLLGTNYQFNDYITGSLLAHHYGTEYRGSLPSSYGAGSDIRNEQGLAFHLHMEPGKTVTVRLTAEVFRHPSPRYLAQVPSGRYRLDLSLQNPPNKALQWRCRLVSNTWQTTPADEISPVRPLLNSRVNRIDGQLLYNHLDYFNWSSRLVIGHYSQKQHSSMGYAAVQQLSYISDHFRIVAQFVLFHVGDWANRIYLHEPSFYYSFSFPVYYGKGQKTTLLLTCKPLKSFSVSTKISIMVKEGKQSLDTGIQLRLKL